jgi:mannitol-1-phosphate 5-dehydrogenase
VADVDAALVAAIRQSHGCFRVNVAHENGVEVREVVEVEVFNPLESADVTRLVEAIAEADEIATALPSVDFYGRGTPAPAELLARGIERKLADRQLPRAIVFAAENHNHAAEQLRAAVCAAFDPSLRTQVDERAAFLNTVIGKMSGVVTDRAQIARIGLAPMVDGGDRAILVEEFNRILISQSPFADFERGISVFHEKPDLLPFEEAKLYGHNAAHALMGYLAHRAGLAFMHQTHVPLRGVVKQAFLMESGGALCRRHAGIDPLFTPAGWEEYVDDLLRRMCNPHLQDRVDRVIRDPCRKLSWNDRLIGTMRLAIQQGIEPRCYAIGAAAAVELLLRERPKEIISTLLADLWREDHVSLADREAIVRRIQHASQRR